MQANSLLQRLAGRSVLVVGDVMIDRYLTGQVTRISPEAPVPVVLQQDSEDRLGGAANVALNIAALDSIAYLCSVAGDDEDGRILRDVLLPQANINTADLVLSESRRSTVKTRVLGNNQQMLRIDKEDTQDLDSTEATQLLERVRFRLDNSPIEVLILQDYNKGVLSELVIGAIIAMASERGIPVAVDPKKRNFLAFKGVTLFKPNLKEIRESAPFSVKPEMESLEQAAAFLRAELDCKWVMITLSENGLYLSDETGANIYPTAARKVADVSGAGDTVISVAALALAAGYHPELVALLSNLAGGQVCEFPGVVSVRKDILERELLHALSH